MTYELSNITLSAIQDARNRIYSVIFKTPLIPYRNSDLLVSSNIYLKLENLQILSSYKLRGVANAVLSVESGQLKDGLLTISAGNLALAVAFMAKKMGIKCIAFVPETGSEMKMKAIRSFGANLILKPYSELWDYVRSGTCSEQKGYLIHQAYNQALIAGYGSIGLEILEDLPDLDVVIIPFGIGGLCLGIASAIRSIKPSVRILACEVDTAAPLTKSLQNSQPSSVNRIASFVDGIGLPEVLPSMWRTINNIIDDVLVVSLEEIRSSIKQLFEKHRIIAEGAGAAAVAAALSKKIEKGKKVVCIVSGGNIDNSILNHILFDN